MNQSDHHQALLSRQAELETLINRRRDILTTPLSEATDELSAYDQHPGDVATDTFEREKELGLLQMLQSEMDMVQSALNKLQAGKFGLCECCGREIEPARLERLSHTDVCASCARTRMDVKQRPPEEDVLRPSQAFMPEWDIAGYSYDEYR